MFKPKNLGANTSEQKKCQLIGITWHNLFILEFQYQLLFVSSHCVVVVFSLLILSLFFSLCCLILSFISPSPFFGCLIVFLFVFSVSFFDFVRVIVVILFFSPLFVLYSFHDIADLDIADF